MNFVFEKKVKKQIENMNTNLKFQIIIEFFIYNETLLNIHWKLFEFTKSNFKKLEIYDFGITVIRPDCGQDFLTFHHWSSWFFFMYVSQNKIFFLNCMQTYIFA